MKNFIISTSWSGDEDVEVIGVLPEEKVSKFIESLLKKGYVLSEFNKKEECYTFEFEEVWNSRWHDHEKITHWVFIERQEEHEIKSIKKLLKKIPSVTEKHVCLGPGLYELDELDEEGYDDEEIEGEYEDGDEEIEGEYEDGDEDEDKNENLIWNFIYL